MNLDPKKMQAMMKQLGMKSEEIEASRVIIEKEDGRVIIENPSVTKITMQGQDQFQITGEVREEEQGFSEEDVKMIVEKTGKSEKEVKLSLEKTKDIAETILDLS